MFECLRELFHATHITLRVRSRQYVREKVQTVLLIFVILAFLGMGALALFGDKVFTSSDSTTTEITSYTFDKSSIDMQGRVDYIFVFWNETEDLDLVKDATQRIQRSGQLKDCRLSEMNGDLNEASEACYNKMKANLDFMDRNNILGVLFTGSSSGQPKYVTFYPPDTSALTDGVSALRAAIDSVLYKDRSGVESDVSMSISVYPKKEKSVSKPGHITGAHCQLFVKLYYIFVCIAFFAVAFNLMSNILSDKDSRIRELLTFMGMEYWPYWIGNMIIPLASMLILCLLVSGLHVAKCSASYGTVFVLNFLHTLDLLAMVTLIAVLFNTRILPYMIASLLMIIMVTLGNSLTYSPALVFLPTAYLIQLQNHHIITNHNIGLDVMAMLLYAVFIFIAALYLDCILPNNTGMKLNPMFLFQRSFWKKSAPSQSCIYSGDHIEPVPEDMHNKCIVQYHAVSHRYRSVLGGPGGACGTTQALQNLYFGIFKSQITCLLGHNGAGKSTAMNLLVGSMKPSSGKVIVDNGIMSEYAHRYDLRRNLGLCFQENVIFPFLTFDENIILVGEIKGMRVSEIAARMKPLIEDIGMSEHRHKPAGVLSGGQKRKLGLIMAIIGNPDLVILDEPTSGMDPVARRGVWKILKDYRQSGKAVLFSTHFMDEADILADRKAIIAKGSLLCVGSSMFIKRMFSAGYTLTVLMEDEHHSDVLRTFLKEHVPSTVCKEVRGREVMFSIPTSEYSNMIDVLERLEDKDMMSQLKITTFGLAVATLDEVFMRILRDGTEKQSDEGFEVDSKTESEISQHSESACLTIWRQIMAFEVIHFWRIVRNPCRVVIRVLLPMLNIISLAMFVASPINIGKVDIFKYPFQPSLLPSRNNFAYYISDGAVDKTTTSILNSYKKIGFEQINTTDAIKDSLKGMNSLSVIAIFKTWKGTDRSVDIHVQGDSDSTASLAAEALSRVLNALTPTAESSMKEWPELWQNSLPIIKIIPLMYLIGILAMVPASFVPDIIEDRESGIQTQLRISGMSRFAYWSSTIISHWAQYFIINAIFMGVASIDTFGFMRSPGVIVLYIICVMLLGTVSHQLSSYILSYPFKGSLSGMLGTLVFYVIVIDAGVILLLVLQQTQRMITNYVFLALLPPFAPFSPLIFAIQLTYGYKDFYDTTGEPPVSSYFKYVPIYVCIPVMAAQIIIQILVIWALDNASLIKHTFSSMHNRCCGSARRSKVYGNLNSENGDHQEDEDVAAEDKHVRLCLDSQSNITDEMLFIQHLSKIFNSPLTCCGKRAKPFRAVNDVNLSLCDGDVVGLLGPNGAGKTTTFSMILDQETPSGGLIVMNDRGAQMLNLSAIKRGLFSSCPQADPLWETITPREHIEFFAAVRGIRSEVRKEVIDTIMHNLKLGTHASKRISQLSGGNKRKVALALAIIGQPRLTFMDEPTTGMDPEARRVVWQYVKQIASRRNRAVLITTHSMEEADSLCNKIGILINGHLVCLGTSQHLKTKFGDGYTLEIKVKAGETLADYQASKEDVISFVRDSFPNAAIKEDFGQRIIFSIPADKVVSLSAVLRLLETQKNELGLEDYTFSQVSLEQIFLSFARNQRDGADADDDMGAISGSINNAV